MHEQSSGAVRGGTPGSGTIAGTEEEPLSTIPLCDTHRTGAFACWRSSRVEGFFANECPLFLERNYCRVFVLPDANEPARILGFYTLAPATLKNNQPSEDYRESIIEDIPVIPMMLIGFMGRDDRAPRGTGEALLVDAARRVHRSQDIAAWGLMLHSEDGPKNKKLWNWYKDQGFDPTLHKGVEVNPMCAPLGKLLA
jgi:hypothetical protein